MKATETAPKLVLQRGLDVQTRVSLEEFRGQLFADFRTWWRPAGEEGFKPTKKGVSIPVESLDELIAVLQGIRRHLEDSGE